MDRNQVGGLAYVLGVLIAGVLALVFWPLSALAAVVWRAP